MPQVKAGKILKSVRLQTKVNDWLEKQAEDNGTTVSVETNMAVREKMARDGALSGAGAQ
jgi:hypothetical protein